MSEEKTPNQEHYHMYHNQGHQNWVRDIRNSGITVPPGEEAFIEEIMPNNELDTWRMNFLSLKFEKQQELIGKWENLKKSPTTDKRKYAEDMLDLLRESKIPNAPQIPREGYMNILGLKVEILEKRCNYIFAPLSGGKKSKKYIMKGGVFEVPKNKRKIQEKMRNFFYNNPEFKISSQAGIESIVWNSTYTNPITNEVKPITGNENATNVDAKVNNSRFVKPEVDKGYTPTGLGKIWAGKFMQFLSDNGLKFDSQEQPGKGAIGFSMNGEPNAYLSGQDENTYKRMAPTINSVIMRWRDNYYKPANYIAQIKSKSAWFGGKKSKKRKINRKSKKQKKSKKRVRKSNKKKYK